MSTKSIWEEYNIPLYSDHIEVKQKTENEDTGDKGKEGKSKSGSGGSPVPEWIIEEKVRFSNWKYIPEKEILINIKVQKQILLSSLNSSFIILNLLKSLKSRPELEFNNFIIELEKVSYIKYKKPLNNVILDHLNHAILWNVKKEEELKIKKEEEELKKKEAMENDKRLKLKIQDKH